MASVRKIETEAAGTRWRVRVFIGRDAETAKRKYLTRTFAKKKDADSWANRIERQKEAGVVTPPSKDPLSKYLKHWLDNVKAGRVRARTLESYRSLVRSYVTKPPEGAPLIGTIRMDRLAPTAFEELYTFLWSEKGLSPRTLQYLHTVLRQALKHAVKTGAVARNPTDHVSPPRQLKEGGTPKPTMRAMSKDEATRFLNAAKSDRYAALWTVLLTGGIRPGEAFGLLWDDVDLDTGKLHIRRALTRRGSEGWKLVEPKTARARRVVILPDLACAALKAHRTRQAEERLKLGSEYENHGLVFTSTFGAPLDAPNLSRHLKRVMAEAELGTWEEPKGKGSRGPSKKPQFRPTFRMYDLRHTCATLLLLAGENPKVVSERLGHASVTLTLDTYSHVLPAMQEESARKLEAMFAST